MTLAELITAVADMVADYPILTAVISLSAVVGGLRALMGAVKRAAK